MYSTDFHKLLIKHKSNFSETEKRIAHYLEEVGVDVVNKTLANLSSETGISEGSFYKFVKKLGFDGFQHFKISIASSSIPEEQPTEITAFSDITKEDTPYVVAQKVLSFTQNALSDLLFFIDEDDIMAALDLISGSETLHFFGQGASSILAFDTYHKFHRSHYRCNYIEDYHMQLSYSTKLGPNDCVFLFSHSGKTVETLEVAKILRENNAKVILLTGNPQSKLGELADTTLVVYSDKSLFRSESLTAKVLYLTLVDILYVNIMHTDEEKNSASLNKIRKAISITRNIN